MGDQSRGHCLMIFLPGYQNSQSLLPHTYTLAGRRDTHIHTGTLPLSPLNGGSWKYVDICHSLIPSLCHSLFLPSSHTLSGSPPPPHPPHLFYFPVHLFVPPPPLHASLFLSVHPFLSFTPAPLSFAPVSPSLPCSLSLPLTTHNTPPSTLPPFTLTLSLADIQQVGESGDIITTLRVLGHMLAFLRQQQGEEGGHCTEQVLRLAWPNLQQVNHSIYR